MPLGGGTGQVRRAFSRRPPRLVLRPRSSHPAGRRPVTILVMPVTAKNSPVTLRHLPGGPRRRLAGQPLPVYGMPNLARRYYRQRSVLEWVGPGWATPGQAVPYMEGLAAPDVMDMTITDPGITRGRAPEGEAWWAHWITSGCSAMFWDMYGWQLAGEGYDIAAWGLEPGDKVHFGSLDCHSCKPYALERAREWTGKFFSAYVITSWPLHDVPAMIPAGIPAWEPSARARRRAARRERWIRWDGMDAEIAVHRQPGEDMRAMIEDARRRQDWLARRSCPLDDPHQLAGWHASWDAYAQAGRLEVATLTLTGLAGGPEVAACVTGFIDHPYYRVGDARPVGRWEEARLVPVLELGLLDRLHDDHPGLTMLDRRRLAAAA
jgi:hypothetical protein